MTTLSICLMHISSIGRSWHGAEVQLELRQAGRQAPPSPMRPRADLPQCHWLPSGQTWGQLPRIQRAEEQLGQQALAVHGSPTPLPPVHEQHQTATHTHTEREKDGTGVRLKVGAWRLWQANAKPIGRHDDHTSRFRHSQCPFQ
jgi:hypothetical protein